MSFKYKKTKSTEQLLYYQATDGFEGLLNDRGFSFERNCVLRRS